MSSADRRDVNGDRRADRASGVPAPPGVTTQDELEQAAAEAVQPELTNVEAVLQTVVELTGMPLAPVDPNGQTARSSHIPAGQ
jgi:hypothetical protein